MTMLSSASILRHKQVLRWRASRSPHLRPIMLGFAISSLLNGVWSIVEWGLAQVVNRPAGAPGAVTGLQLAMIRTTSLDLRLDLAFASLGLGLVCLAFTIFWPRLFSEIRPRLERFKRAHPAHFPVRRPSRRARWFASRGIFAIAMMPLVPMLAWSSGAIAFPSVAALWPMQAKSSLVMAASFLIAFPLTFNYGSGRRCSRCEYRMTTFRGSPDLCPECGSHWKHLGGTIFGRRPPRALLYLGVAMLLAAAAIWALVPIA